MPILSVRTMAQYVPTGILIHARPEWPCDGCRGYVGGPKIGFLCLECASSIVASAIDKIATEGFENLHLYEALNVCDAEAEPLPHPVLWPFPWSWFRFRR